MKQILTDHKIYSLADSIVGTLGKKLQLQRGDEPGWFFQGTPVDPFYNQVLQYSKGDLQIDKKWQIEYDGFHWTESDYKISIQNGTDLVFYGMKQTKNQEDVIIATFVPGSWQELLLDSFH